MTGKYTNGSAAYKTSYITLGVIDNIGNIVATGLDSISQVDPFQTKSLLLKQNIQIRMRDVKLK